MGELRDIIEAVYAAAGAGDWNTTEQYLSDDLVIEEANSLPYPGRYTGKRALRELFGIVMAHWADPRIEIHAITEGDGHVVALVTFHMTSRRSGKRIAMPLAEAWRIADGKVVSVRPYYFDTATMVAFERP